MFNVKSSKIRITDPCYTKDTWCTGLVTALNGDWKVEVETSDEGDWGIRNAVLTATHVDHDRSATFITNLQMGVDSGQGGVFDEGSYPKGDTTGEFGELDTFYGKCCHITCPQDGTEAKEGGDYVEDIGYVCSSGFGDGGYNVEVFGLNGVATKIVITFIEEAEEEVEDEEEDYDFDNENEFDDEGELEEEVG